VNKAVVAYFKLLAHNLPADTEGYENIIQDNRSPSRDSNTGLIKHETDTNHHTATFGAYMLPKTSIPKPQNIKYVVI
jgi:hypothetical protein